MHQGHIGYVILPTAVFTFLKFPLPMMQVEEASRQDKENKPKQK